MSAPAEHQNIVIIGGGIIGCATAFYLTRHPSFDPSIHSVTVIEAAKVANGASGKAGGLLAAWAYPSSLARLSFDLHAQLAHDYNGAELWGYRRVRCGQLTCVVSPREDTRGWDLVNHPDIDLRKYWAREPRASSRVPADLDWINSDSALAYEEFADSASTAQVHPLQFTSSLARLAEQNGARIIMGRVENINCCATDDVSESASPLTVSDDISQKKVVSVTFVEKAAIRRHTLPATTVVLAAGPWTPTLLPKVQIHPLRAHSVTMKLQRPLSAYCLFSDIQLTAGKESIPLEIYPRPNNEVYIYSRGDMNIPLPPPENTVQVSFDTCQNIINAAIMISDEFRNGQVTGRRACYLPVLDIQSGNDPLVGPTELSGLILATGHSCWGISNAPGTGHAIAELVFEGKISSVDATTIDPRRIR